MEHAIPDLAHIQAGRIQRDMVFPATARLMGSSVLFLGSKRGGIAVSHFLLWSPGGLSPGPRDRKSLTQSRVSQRLVKSMYWSQAVVVPQRIVS